MASAYAKCGVRIILVTFIACFIYLCHAVIHSNNHTHEIETLGEKTTNIASSTIGRIELKDSDINEPLKSSDETKLSHTNIIPAEIKSSKKSDYESVSSPAKEKEDEEEENSEGKNKEEDKESSRKLNLRYEK
jgi:hypothetical protein